MGEYFGYLGSGHSVLLRRFEMVLERGIGQSLRHQGHYGYDGTVAERKQIVPAPHFPEKNIIVQTCKFGGKFSERIASGSLLDFTCDFAMIGKIKVNNKANDATFVFIRYDF